MSFLLADLLRLRKTQAFLPHMYNPYAYSAGGLSSFHSPPSQNLEDHDKTEQAIVRQTEALSLRAAQKQSDEDERKQQ